MSPMGTDLADIRGNATPRLIAYYTERAKGGIGLIINEYTGVDDVDSIPTQHNLRMAQDYNVQEAEELTRSVHAYGAKIFAQLHHGGATSKSAFTGRQNLSPSGVPMAPGGEVPREMTLEEFRRTAERPRSAPAPPRLHRPPGHRGRPGSPCRERRLRRPHLHPPVRRGGHPYPPGRSRTCPRRERVSAPPTSAAPHARTDGRARPAEAPARPSGRNGLYGRPPSRPALSAPLRRRSPGTWRGEVLNTYIVVEQGDKVLFIDKHAAHERLNFDRMKAEGYQPMVQALLEPVVFTPPAEEGAALLAQLPLLGRFGFEAEDFGGGALIVRAAPSDVAAGEIPDVLSELAGRLLTGGSADPGAARDALLHTMACKAAHQGRPEEQPRRAAQGGPGGHVRRGQILPPTGGPVAIELTRQQLEKRFGRA